MQDTPPRRRSRPKPPSGGSSLPFIPIIIGVIVLGFVIGAGLSVVGKHGGGDTVALATSSPFTDDTPSAGDEPSPTPIPAAPRKAPDVASPREIATLRPTPSPKPSPRSSPSASSSGAASAAPSASPSRAPSTVAAVARATSQPLPTPSLAPRRTASPVPTAAPVAASSERASVPETIVPQRTTNSATVDADSDFSRLAGNVVRQYLLSISRGDTDSAYAALGDPPGSNVSVPEAGAVDSTMTIRKIQARGGDSSATVDVEITTASGPYSGQYTVHRSATGAAIIVSHTFGKP